MAQGLNLAVEGQYHSPGLGFEVSRPPLFPFLLSLGYRFLGPSIATSFWVPKGLGLLAILAVLFLGDRVFGECVGLVAAGLTLAVSYFNEYLFARVLVDGPQAAMILLGTLYLLLGFEKRRKRYFAVAAASVAWAFLIKESAIWWFPLPVVLFLTIREYRDGANLIGLSFLYALLIVLISWWWLYVYVVDGSIYLLGAGVYQPLGRLVPSELGVSHLFSVVSLLLVSMTLLTFSLWLPGKRLILTLRTEYEKRLSLAFSAVGVLVLIVFLAGASSGFSYEMLKDYWLSQVLPIVRTDPLLCLLIPGWLYTGYLAVRRRDSLSVACVVYFAFNVPIVTVLVRWQNQPRNMLPLLIFSCLPTGKAIVSLVRNLWRRGWTVARMPGQIVRLVAAGVALITAGVVISCSVSFESPLTGGSYERLAWSANHKCSSWMRENVEANSDVIMHSVHGGEFYFLVQGTNYHFHNWPGSRTFLQYTSAGRLFADDDKISIDSRNEPIQGARNYYFVGELNLISTLLEKEIDYVVYMGGEDNFGYSPLLDSYFETHSAYTLMCRGGSSRKRLSVYRVSREKLSPTHVTYVDPVTVSRIIADARAVLQDVSDYQILDGIGDRIKLGSEDIEEYLKIGALYLRAGMLQTASEIYQEILTLDQMQDSWLVAKDSGEISSTLSRAMLHTLEGEYQSAIQLYRQALQTNPEMIAIHIGLGDNYLLLGQIEEAEAAFRKAILIDPSHPEANSRLGDLYRGCRNLGEAIKRYSIACQNSNAGDAHRKFLLTMAEYQQGLGNLAEAVAYYRRALRYPYTLSGLAAAQSAGFELLDLGPLSKESSFCGVSVFFLETSKLVLFQHPPCQVDYRLTLPKSVHMEFSLALSPEAWQAGKGDGVQYDAYINDGLNKHHLFSKYIDPKNLLADRRWHDYEIDLSPWADQTITLTFSTGCGPNNDCRYDWAGWGEPRIVQPIAHDFLDELSNAGRSIADQEQIRQDTFSIDYEPRIVLFEHPSNRVTYRVDVPQRAGLHFGLGMDPSVWSPDKGDGVEYNVYVGRPDDPYVLHRVFRRYVDPKNNPDDRHWHDEVVDLSEYGGETVDIVFETLPGPENDSRYDWAGWSRPVLVGDDMALLNQDVQVPVPTPSENP